MCVDTTGRWGFSFPLYLRQKTIFMEQIKATQFKKVNANEPPNAEQLLCGKALDSVIALDIFDEYVFMDLDLCPTNHLLKWCVEVLTA